MVIIVGKRELESSEMSLLRNTDFVKLECQSNIPIKVREALFKNLLNEIDLVSIVMEGYEIKPSDNPMEEMINNQIIRAYINDIVPSSLIDRIWHEISAISTIIYDSETLKTQKKP